MAFALALAIALVLILALALASAAACALALTLALVCTLPLAFASSSTSGLVLALALSKRENVYVTVFEKSSDHKNIPTFNPSRSYIIDITGHGEKAIKYLNVQERLKKILLNSKDLKFQSFGQGLVKNITEMDGQAVEEIYVELSSGKSRSRIVVE